MTETKKDTNASINRIHVFPTSYGVQKTNLCLKAPENEIEQLLLNFSLRNGFSKKFSRRLSCEMIKQYSALTLFARPHSQSFRLPCVRSSLQNRNRGRSSTSYRCRHQPRRNRHLLYRDLVSLPIYHLRLQNAR